MSEDLNVRVETITRWVHGRVLPTVPNIKRIEEYTMGIVTASDMINSYYKTMKPLPPPKKEKKEKEVEKYEWYESDDWD